MINKARCPFEVLKKKKKRIKKIKKKGKRGF